MNGWLSEQIDVGLVILCSVVRLGVLVKTFDAVSIVRLGRGPAPCGRRRGVRSMMARARCSVELRDWRRTRPQAGRPHQPLHGCGETRHLAALPFISVLRGYQAWSWGSVQQSTVDLRRHRRAWPSAVTTVAYNKVVARRGIAISIGEMTPYLSQPWPWYVAGPLIGLIIPALLLVGGKMFGVSENLRHICAAVLPQTDFLKYDWRRAGAWNLTLIAGAVIGGFIASTWIPNPHPIALAPATRADLAYLGVTDLQGLAPVSIFSWHGLLSIKGFLLIVVGGFMVGFGSKYAGGCTSGHALMGLADLQISSLIAVIGFFIGGLIATYLLFPFVFHAGGVP